MPQASLVRQEARKRRDLYLRRLRLPPAEPEDPAGEEPGGELPLPEGEEPAAVPEPPSRLAIASPSVNAAFCQPRILSASAGSFGR